MKTLAEKWGELLAPFDPEKLMDTKDRNRAKKTAATIIEQIPEALAVAAKLGHAEIDLGEFEQEEIPSRRCDFYPSRTELRGSAIYLFDYCQANDVHLFAMADDRRGIFHRIVIRRHR